MRVLRGGGVAVAVALVVATAGTAPAAGSARSPARAPAGACPDRTGITVVVDKTAFGGGVEVRCAAQPVRSGFEALTKAGFSYSGTVRFPGLLCRIDGQPASDPCQGAPPPDAYWAYWHAERGGAWTYSTAGAARTPPPGSVEGWAFGAKAAPGAAPPPPHPTTPPTPAAPAPTAPPATTPAGADSPREAPDAGPPDGEDAPPSNESDPGRPADPPTSESGARALDAVSEAAAPPTMVTSGQGAVGSDAGSPVGALVTAGALAGAGLLVVRVRRERRERPDG